MSGFQPPPPPPVPLPAKTPADKRVYSCTFKPLLGTTTLINAGTIVITRGDGNPMGSGDLVASAPSLDATSQIVVATFTAGNVGVTYNIAVTGTASDGQIYVRTATCLVTAALG